MNTEPNIATLLRQLRDDTTALVREEVVLAKTEIGEKLSVAGTNAAYLAVGALVGSSALLLFLVSLSFLLAQMMSRRGIEEQTAEFLGFLIIAVIVGIVSSLLISKAIKTLSGESIKPDRTVQSLREDKQWAQNKMS